MVCGFKGEMMKKNFLLIIFFICFLQTISFAQNFQKYTKNIKLLQKGKHSDICPECGMKLSVFGKTNHAVKLKNGKYIQFCSIRDLIKAEREKGFPIEQYFVVDAKNEIFKDATKMWYVVGSSIKGTMSTVSKISFSEKKNAIEFKKEFGGEVMSFIKAKEISEKILDKDMKEINRKNALSSKFHGNIHLNY